jgi:thioredoxin
MDREAFNQKLRSTGLPVIVDVWAPWCGPCRLIEPSLKKLAQEYQGRVEVWKINADVITELVRSLGIYGIPALLVFHGEQELVRTTGAQPLVSLARLFETALSGETAPKIGIPLQDRLLRGAIGIGLIAAAWWLDRSFRKNRKVLYSQRKSQEGKPQDT